MSSISSTTPSSSSSPTKSLEEAVHGRRHRFSVSQMQWDDIPAASQVMAEAFVDSPSYRYILLALSRERRIPALQLLKHL